MKMAVAKIKKLEIIGLQKDKDNLLALLQKLGLVELHKPQETAAISCSGEGSANLLEMEEAISFLASFQQKTGMLAGMINFKPVVYERELKETIASFDYQDSLKVLTDLRSQFKNLIQQKEKLIQESSLLTPWRSLKIPLDQPHYTGSCGIILGALRSGDYANLLENCRAEKIDVFCEVINQDKTNTRLIIFYLKEAFQRLEAVLKNYHFNFVTLGRHRGLVEERISEVKCEIRALDNQVQEVKNKIVRLSGQQPKLMMVYDYLDNLNRRQQAEKDLSKQQFTFYLSGWIRQKDVPKLQHALSEKFKSLVMFISEPKADENIPVDLENNRLIQPFEFITKIYGFPLYSELDPTAYLAPFFFIYFGMCVSDVGYGFILALFSWFALKKFKLGQTGLRFFKLFLFCGISTIIVGALTGSWFGNLIDLLAESNKVFITLKKFKDGLIILNPMQEPTRLLGIALCFGITQIWFGHLVAVIGNIKNKRYLDIFLDQVPMLVFLLGLTGLGVIFLKLFPTTYINLFKLAALLGAAGLVLTQGRAEKGIGSKLFYGMYNLYNSLSGYLSDTLSYSRLWALGLVTSVMAGTINLISIQFSQIFVSVVPFVDRIGFLKVIISSLILIFIFVTGHLVSFLMSLLGAFVHPVRLQFVEFFPKFFKSGGNPFRSFRIETRYIDMS